MLPLCRPMEKGDRFCRCRARLKGSGWVLAPRAAVSAKRFVKNPHFNGFSGGQHKDDHLADLVGLRHSFRAKAFTHSANTSLAYVLGAQKPLAHSFQTMRSVIPPWAGAASTPWPVCAEEPTWKHRRAVHRPTVFHWRSALPNGS